MSESDATSATPEGGEAEAASAAAEPAGEGNASEKGGPASGDLIEKMRSDPEFAVEQYRKLQSGFTKASQKAKAAETMLRYAEVVGNGNVDEGMKVLESSIQSYSKVRQHPKLQKVVDQYLQTEKLPADLRDSDDFEEEEEDPQEARVRALQEEVSALKRGQAKTQIRSDMEKVLAEFPEEQRGEVAGAIEGQIEQLEKQGATDTLKSLNKRALRTLALAALWPEDQDFAESKLASVVESLHRAKQDRKHRASTGEPGVRSTGREDSSPGDRDSGKSVAEIARQAMKEARKTHRLAE